MMIKNLTSLILLILAFASSAIMGQGTGKTQNEPSQEAAATPPLISQKSEQTQNLEQRDAWQIIEQTPDLTEKAQLAERFLENYPESSLAPNAHYLIARNAFRLGKIEKFVQHAELALEEIDLAPDLQAELAFVYSERGRTEQAILRANQSLENLNRMDKPPGVPAIDWVSQIYQLKGEAYYALGRAHLNKMGESEGEQVDPELKAASEYFEKALDFNPEHDYAAFRLAFAKRNMNDVEGTIMSYARAVAIGNVAATPARRDLQEVLSILKEAMPDSLWAEMSVEDAVEQARAKIEEDLTENQQEKARLAQELQASEAFIPQAPPSLRPSAPSPSEGSGTESRPPQQ